MTCLCGGGLNFTVVIITLLAVALLSVAPYYGLLDSPHHDYSKQPISYVLDDSSSKVAGIILIVGSIAVFFVAIAREIQLRVIFDRCDKYTGIIRGLNVCSSIMLVIGEIALIISVLFERSEFESLHGAASISAFALILLYHLFHIILTLVQRCSTVGSECGGYYCNSNCFVKYFELFYYVPVWIMAAVSILIFGFYQLKVVENEDYYQDVESAHENELFGLFGYESHYFYEWWSFWLINSVYLVIAFMFYRDPVNDELYEFCTCGGGSRRETRSQMEMVTV